MSKDVLTYWLSYVYWHFTEIYVTHVVNMPWFTMVVMSIGKKYNNIQCAFDTPTIWTIVLNYLL